MRYKGQQCRFTKGEIINDTKVAMQNMCLNEVNMYPTSLPCVAFEYNNEAGIGRLCTSTSRMKREGSDAWDFFAITGK